MKTLKIFISSLFILLALTVAASAQLTGIKTIPGTYPDLASAITDLNTQGVGAGGVTFNLTAGNPQTAPAGGYVIGGTGSAVLGTASAANPIVFNGGSNIITAPTPQTSGNLNDAIFKLIGADWVTLDSFTLRENAANTTTAAGTNNMTEFGVALFYVTAADGAQNDSITNCTVDLDRTYQNTFGIYANATHTAAAMTTTATATGPAGGNSGLKIYACNITDVNNGIVVVGPTAAADNNDGIDIGGAALAFGNTITNYGTTGTFSGYANVSGTVNGILVRNSKNFNVSFNTVQSSVGGVTVGTLNGIQQPAASNSQTGTFTNNINSNTISLQGGLIAGAINGINIPSGSGSLTSTLNINGNNFTALNHTVAGTGTIQGIVNVGTSSVGPLTHSISNNTFTNISANTTGNFTFINNSWARPTNGVANINGNSISGTFAKTGVGGTVTIYTSNSTSGATINEINNNNNFSNMTVSGSTILQGWRSTDGGTPIKSVNGNTFSNWTGGSGQLTGLAVSFSGSGNVTTNTVSNFNCACAIVGIESSSGTQTFTQNTVHSLSSSGVFAVTGIAQISAGTTQTFARNKVYGLSNSNAGGTVFGITVAAGTTISLQNNIIGDLTAPAANATLPIAGINITGGTTVLADFNTVYLNATSSGALFGTAAINAATAPALTLRNNIFVNLSTPTGAGENVAYRRTSATLSTYNNASNNNLFYAGAPSATNLLFTDLTTDHSTLAGYKTFVGPTRDTFSITENPTFVSTTGSNVNFLHISTAVATQIESGGTPVAGITDDFDGNTRNVTSPDIGADEFAGILLDLNGPTITHTPAGNTGSTGDRVISISVTDPSGVAGGAGSPNVYFRKNGAGPYFGNQCVFVSGSNYNCTIVAATVGGLVTTDTIQYYIVAQDTVNNVSALPSAGAGGFSTNPPAAATPPTTPFTYTIVTALGGSISVGTAETYTSLTNPGGLFEAINNGVVNANLNVNLTSDLTAETGTVALNQVNEEGAGGYIINISASGGARLVSGSNTTALINFNGADRVILNGLAFGPYGITIRNTSATTGAVVQYVNDASNNSILSCRIEGGNTSTSSALVLYGTGTTTGNDSNAVTSSIVRDRTDVAGVPANAIASLNGSTTARNSGINIVDNQIMNFINNGIAASVGLTSENWNISSNDISQNAARAATTIGINTGGMQGANTISNNKLHGFVASGTNAVAGMLIGNVATILIERNQIYDFQTTAGATAVIEGMEFGGASGSTSNGTIINNFVTIAPTLTTAQAVIGIQDNSFSGNVFTANHNSIYIGGTASGASPSWALRRASAAPTTYSARNNIAFNARTGGTSSHFAGGDQSAATGTFVSDNNTWVGLGATPANFMDYGSSSTGTPVTIAAWQAGPPARDAASSFFTSTSVTGIDIFVNPATNDLHIFANSIGGVIGGGTVVPVPADIDGDPRPATAPDRGADELVQAQSGLLSGGFYYNALLVGGDTLTGNVTITNVLYLNGVVNGGANTLTIGCNASVFDPPSANYIDGAVRKDFCAAGAFNFPVGQGGRTPVGATVTALGTNPSSLTVTSFDATLSGFAPGQSLSRNWLLTETGDLTADLVFGYLDPGDVNGTESDYRVYSRNGAGVNTNYCPGSPCVNTGSNVSTPIVGVTNFSRWTMAQLQTATAASANIDGRVLTADGRPIANVKVVLSGGGLSEPITAYTGQLGYYSFTDLPVGQNYVLTVKSRRFQFADGSRVITLNDDLTGFDFFADPQE